MTNLAPTIPDTLRLALDRLEQDKAAIIPCFLDPDELGDLLAAWQRLFDDPSIQLEKQRFIVDQRLYEEPSFARLAVHPVVQEMVRRVIGDFRLAGYSVVATPPNGELPTSAESVAFHIDHNVYSDVAVAASRDTFVCVWVNFEDLALENGPFALAVGSHHLNLGYPEFVHQFGARILSAGQVGWEKMAAFNVGPAGTTAVYSGKTWHSGTPNCSNRVRKGLNLNFVPRRPQDSNRLNYFDACGLATDQYHKLERLIGVPDYLVARDSSLAEQAAARTGSQAGSVN